METVNSAWLVLILVLLAISLFLPKYGLFSFIRSSRTRRQREAVEDALKHLLDQS